MVYAKPRGDIKQDGSPGSWEMHCGHSHENEFIANEKLFFHETQELPLEIVKKYSINSSMQRYIEDPAISCGWPVAVAYDVSDGLIDIR